MSYLHDWKKAPEELVQEFVECLNNGDSQRARAIKGIVHAKNKLAKDKNPGVIARLMGYIQGKTMPK